MADEGEMKTIALPSQRVIKLISYEINIMNICIRFPYKYDMTECLALIL